MGFREGRTAPRRDPPPEGQGAVAWAALRWGLGSGMLGGGFIGTFLFPVIGTVVGLVLGVAAAAVPTVVATAALVLAARPGTPGPTYARRAVVIVLAVTGCTTMIAVGQGLRVLEDGGLGGVAIAGGIAAAVVALAGILPIATVRPVPAGADTADPRT